MDQHSDNYSRLLVSRNSHDGEKLDFAGDLGKWKRNCDVTMNRCLGSPPLMPWKHNGVFYAAAIFVTIHKFGKLDRSHLLQWKSQISGKKKCWLAFIIRPPNNPIALDSRRAASARQWEPATRIGNSPAGRVIDVQIVMGTEHILANNSLSQGMYTQRDSKIARCRPRETSLSSAMVFRWIFQQNSLSLTSRIIKKNTQFFCK